LVEGRVDGLCCDGGNEQQEDEEEFWAHKNREVIGKEKGCS
jgi:hypothetical protein